MSVGWRQQLADVVSAIRATLATNLLAGSLSAADFAKLATMSAGGTQIFQSYLSALIDFTAPANGYLIIPGQANYYPYVQSFAIIVTSAAGTFTTGPLLRAGQNAGHTNIMALQAASAYTAGAHSQIVSVGTPFRGPIGVPISAGATPGEQAPFTPGDPVLLDVATGSTGTGGYVLSGKILCTYAMVPA